MSTAQDLRVAPLDVEQIMAEIRADIAHRQQRGELEEPELGGYRPFQSIPPDLMESQKECNTRWNQIYEPFEVRSRLPLLGRLWAALRRSIHSEVRSYLEPMVYRQIDFNAAAVHGLNALVRELYGGPRAKNLRDLNREVLALRRQLQELQARVQRLEQKRARRKADG